MDFGIKQNCENCKHADVVYADAFKRKIEGVYCNRFVCRMDMKRYKTLMNCMAFERKEDL